MKNWRGERHPRYVDTSPGAPAVALAVGERRRIVYVGITRAKDALYVTATREEPSAHEVGANGIDEHDHFAEILSWALAHPESAAVVESEQLELPVSRLANGQVHDDPSVVAAVLDRLERIQPAAPAPAKARITPVELSFSQLHDFEVCPVRYRFGPGVGGARPARRAAAASRRRDRIDRSRRGGPRSACRVAQHRRDLLQLYRGPEAGREMLARYIALPLSGGRTLAVEAGFKMAVGGTRVRGVVDRICEIEGKVALIDFKTNAISTRR